MVDLEHTGADHVPPAGAGRPAMGRNTPQRAEVLRALVGCDDFVSAQALHAAMAANGSRVGLTTVYRALTALADTGHADTVREATSERLYRHRPDHHHRHYLICRRCGQSEPVDTTLVEAWAQQLAEYTGYADLHHTLELAGVCGPCHSAQTAR